MLRVKVGPRSLAALTLFFAGLVAVASLDADESHRESPESGEHNSLVGIATKIEQLVIPGPEVVVRPITQQTPVVVRIVKKYPHGSDTRYDLEYYGLDPGRYQLFDFLQRVDGTPIQDVAGVTIVVSSKLPPGQIEPSKLHNDEIKGVGGYESTMWVLGVLWVAGLFAIIFVGRGKKSTEEAIDSKPVTLADRLRPLVDKAIRGESSHEKLAELELTLIAFWRKRLGLDGQVASLIISDLHKNEEAGPLLVQLQEWLHNPSPSAKIDVEAMLKPYRDLPPDSLDAVANTEVAASSR